MKIFDLSKEVFWLSNDNKIERVKLIEFKLTTEGGSYLIQLNNKEFFVSEKELYEFEYEIPTYNFNDFFYIHPILESDGLDGRNFPRSKTTYNFLAIYKVDNIKKIFLRENNNFFDFEATPFGIIKTEELKKVGIEVSKIKKDSSFIEDNELHTQSIVAFNNNLPKLFKKITYSRIDMNATTTRLVGGGGFSFDPQNKNQESFRIFYDLSLENIIIKSKLEISNNIFDIEYFENESLYRYNSIAKNDTIIKQAKDTFYLIRTKEEIYPKTLNVGSLKQIEYNLGEEKTINFYNKKSKIIPEFFISPIIGLKPLQVFQSYNKIYNDIDELKDIIDGKNDEIRNLKDNLRNINEELDTLKLQTKG